MLRAVGMTDDDWGKAQVGVASSWNEVTPCNMPLDRLAKRAKEGVRAAGGFPMEFVTIAVSDGISMGHEGMRGSLVSREIIADSVECMVHSERLDALVTFAGCDKSLPGMLMAAARTNVPSVFLYGGSILPGHYKGQALDVVSVFEAVGACAAGTITENELGEIEKCFDRESELKQYIVPFPFPGLSAVWYTKNSPNLKVVPGVKKTYHEAVFRRSIDTPAPGTN